MLGGAPSSDRRVQDQLNELLASKSRPELWEVLRLLREFLGGDRAAAKQYFAERPGLTKAVFQAQVLLGELDDRLGAVMGVVLAAVCGGSYRSDIHGVWLLFEWRCWQGPPAVACVSALQLFSSLQLCTPDKRPTVFAFVNSYTLAPQ